MRLVLSASLLGLLGPNAWANEFENDRVVDDAVDGGGGGDRMRTLLIVEPFELFDIGERSMSSVARTWPYRITAHPPTNKNSAFAAESSCNKSPKSWGNFAKASHRLRKTSPGHAERGTVAKPPRRA